jgi:hypothetical protein
MTVKKTRVGFATLAATILSFTACAEPAAPNNLIDDSAIARDVAVSSGDAAAEMIQTLIGNESSAGGAPELAGASPSAPTDVQVSRSRTCYDANGTAMSSCLPFSSVRMVVTTVSLAGSSAGSRTNSTGAEVTWTAAVHRDGTDTTRRIFNGNTETSRVHVSRGSAKDTVTATEARLSRLLAVTAVDSVKNITFNLPRSSNPYPASGSFVRTATVHAEVSKEGRSASRDASFRVEVVFPADAQANVALKVNSITCQLNLVTRAVTNCQ